jgi:hypothetical protein
MFTFAAALLLALLALPACKARDEDGGGALDLSVSTPAVEIASAAEPGPADSRKETPAGDEDPRDEDGEDRAGALQPDSGSAYVDGLSGVVSATDTVAYFLDGMLYGGVAYTNNSDFAVTLSEATFDFTYSGGSKSHTFTPNELINDVLLPGETGYCTLFLELKDEENSIITGGEVRLAAQLRGVSTDKQKPALDVSSARLIQNYPGFATLSGRLMNNSQEPCDLMMVYVSFYDENNKLLGVWYFTQNALLQPGSGTAFVVHLRSLPIPNLAQNTKRMLFRAYRM